MRPASRSEARTPRLYCADALGAGADIVLPVPQAHYLVTVMRATLASPVLLFNERDGEWHGSLREASRKRTIITCTTCRRHAQPLPDVDFVFAPLRPARMEYLVQKATELGARRLRPVITRHTVPGRVNMDRMRANMIEAAEQCGLVGLPELLEPVSLEDILARWEPGRCLVHCDETRTSLDPLASLADKTLPAAVLIGPEGGFEAGEIAHLQSLSFVTGLSLGPRILRADTAGLAALVLVQSVLGDWRQGPAAP